MCTKVCPCFYDVNDLTHYQAWAAYSQVNKDYLAVRGRKWASTDGTPDDGLKPFYWTSNSAVTFMAFEDCFVDWVMKKEKDPSIKLNEVFGISEDELKAQMEFARTRPIGATNKNLSFMRAFNQNFKLMLELEDEHECSGMCRPGLFYYGRDVKLGPPK